MLRLRHSLRLAREFGSYARRNRAWWLLLVVPALAVVLLVTTATQAAVPYAVYTLF